MNTQFQEYTHDSQIPDREYCNYLKKYALKYILFRSEDNIIQIRCLGKGHIDPNGLVANKLGFYVEFKSKSKLTRFLKTIPDYVVVKQQADWECYLQFPEDKLEELEPIFNIKKRRVLSQITKDKYIMLIKKAREAKLGSN